MLETYLTIPQTQFLRLECKFPLMVSGYGSGKSEILMLSALRDVTMFAGARVGVYSDTYDQLQLNLFPRFEDAMNDAGMIINTNKSENSISFEHDGKENKLIFRSIDNPKRIIGYEVFRSHVDEIEAAENEQKSMVVWRKIVARNRQKFGKLKNRVSVYTTPDQGFGFTYKKWGLSTNPEYQFVRASTRSNPHNPDDYVQTLIDDYGDDELIRALVEGEWCNLTSGSVYSSFNRDFCNTDREVKQREPLHIGMDFNIFHMAAIVFVQTEYGTAAVDEFIDYADTPAIIDAIKERYPGNHVTVYPDASGKNGSSTGASTSDISLLKQAGFVIKAHDSNPRVRNRVVCVNKRLSDGTVKINLSKCPQITESLEKQAYDKNGQPDKTQGYDHPCDAFGYRVVYTYPLRSTVPQTIWVR